MNCSYTVVTFEEQFHGLAVVSWYPFVLGGDVDPHQKLKAQVYDGIIVMDQFGMIDGNLQDTTGDKVPWQTLLGSLLYQVYLRTGFKCVGICMEYAVFDETDFNMWSYGFMMYWISDYFHPPRFMLWVSQGNDVQDLYDPIKGDPIEDRFFRRSVAIGQDVLTLLAAAKRFCPEQRMVLGLHSGITVDWYMDARMCAAYDRCWEDVVDVVSSPWKYTGKAPGCWSLLDQWPGDGIASLGRDTFPCIRGAGLFDGIYLEVGGRASFESFWMLCDGFTVLTKWGMTPANSSMRSRFANHWYHGTPWWKMPISKL